MPNRSLPLADRLRELCPEQTDRLDAVSRTVGQHTDPALLELVRLRVATLIGHPGAGVRSASIDPADLPDGKVAALPQWPTDERFDERERDCLAFTEQFVMDVGNLSDEQAAAVSRHFAPADFYAFVNAVYLADFGQRLELVSRTLFPGVAA